MPCFDNLNFDTVPFDLRNQAKRDTRDLMSDRAAAAKLDKESPLPTWDDMMQKTADKGFEGDDAYKYIRDASARSNKKVDKSLNLSRKKEEANQ